MEEHTNSARRLLVLVKKALKQSEQMATVQVWANVLGLDSKAAMTDPHDVQEKLGLIRLEVNYARTLMAETPFSAELYEQYLEKVKNVVTVPNITAPWSSYRGNLQADTILALGYCSEILVPEPIVSMDELQDVLDALLKVKSEIETLSPSPAVKQFLFRQLSIIETAIRDYPISGSRSLQKAFHTAHADIVSTSCIIEEPKDKEAYSKLEGIWHKFGKGTNTFVALDKFATAFMKRIDQGQSFLLDLLSK